MKDTTPHSGRRMRLVHSATRSAAVSPDPRPAPANPAALPYGLITLGELYRAGQVQLGTEVYPDGPWWETLPQMITGLEPWQMFVFGSDEHGLHRRGHAGLAFRSQPGPWKQDTGLQAALTAPDDSALRRGRWAVLGVSRGPGLGREGRSYAVQVTRGDRPRSVTPDELATQLHALCDHAGARHGGQTLIPPLAEGSAGYRRSEIAAVWQRVASERPQRRLPAGLRFIRALDGVDL